MTSIPLVAGKRLETKRAVRRMAKNVRASVQSSLRNGDSKEFWQNLEKSQADDTSKICARQLLLMRLELKESLRNACSDDHIVEEIMLSTGLGREAVIAILEKYGYREGNEGDSPENEEDQYVTSLPKSSRVKGGNVTFDVPKLDISEVRNDRHSPEDASPPSAHIAFEEILHSPKIQQIGKSTPDRGAGERGAAIVGNSPREVTDSSAEISDLAKRFGARFYQDASLVDQLRNVNREKSFVEQLRDIIATSATMSTVQFKFIPSVPLANPAQAATICKEIDVQTSIRVTELPVLTKELRDNATDVPSLDYLSMSDLGGLQHLPEAFAATQEDASSSAFSSDQSAGQAAGSMVSKAHTIIPFDRDGSVQIPPSKTVRVSDLVESSLPFGVEADGSSLRDSKFTTPSRPAGKASPRTPRVSESPWRPSSRRLHLEEVDISTSQENDSIEVISVSTPQTRRRLVECSSTAGREIISDTKDEHGAVEDEHSTKESSDSSHQDEEHTCNQVSQIASE